MYPNRSTAMSPDPWSCWWGERDGATLRICATQGATLVRRLQRRLRSLVGFYYIIPEVGYGDFARDIQVDGIFGPHTLGGIARVLEDRDTPASMLAAVRRDLTVLAMRQNTVASTGTPVSQETMLAAVWIAYHENGESLSRLVMPEGGMEPFRWLTAAPADGANVEQKQCWNPFTDRMPGTWEPVGGSLPIVPSVAPSSSSSSPSPSSNASSPSSAISPTIVLGSLAALGVGVWYLRRRR
jgi:hypothetical protein